jgi:CheY-like chemotaxis protein
MAKILVVDDDAGIVALMQEYLQGLGHVVATAHDVAGALQAVAAEKPDLIMLDFEMPGGSGGLVAERLAAAPGTADMRIIFLSARPLTQVAQSVKPSALYRFLTKPVNFEILERTLKEFLGSAKA